MKKLVLFIGVLILLSSNSLLLRAEDNSIIQEDNKVWTVSSECEIKEVENGLLYIENNSIKYIYRNQEICCIQEDYLAHVVDSNYLYLVTNNNGLIYLRSIKLDDKKESITLINMNICSQISIIDNELILVGSSNNDASITRYTKKLSLIYEYKYGGIGNEEFLKMYYFDNKYYVIGKKDAHSQNSPFMDVGSLGEIKTFVSIIDKNGIIENSIYFNFNETEELLYTSGFVKGKLMVSLKLQNSYQTYILDSNLNILDLKETLDLSFKILLSNTGNILYISMDKIKVEDEEFRINIQGKILYFGIVDNVLKIYFYYGQYIWESNIYQYKIDNKEDIVINLFNAEFDPKMNMNNLKELKISSYIHNLTLELDSIEPYFSKQIPGVYTGHFKIIVNEEKYFEIDNNINIEEYVNIYDNHIYPVGYKLKFFGYGLLDGKSIVSDTVLKEEGAHVLSISDAFGNSKKYTFQVVKDYYFDQEEYTFADYTIRKNEVMELNLKTNKVVENIYINDQKVDFVQVNEDIKIVLNGFINSGIYTYKINKIEYSNEVKNIDKSFIIRVLKDEPVINIAEEKNENFTLKIDFIDYDLSIRDLVFEVYYDGNLKEILHSYLGDLKYIVGNIRKDKMITINGYLLYDIGDGELKKVEILKSSFYIDDAEYELLDISRVENQIKMEIKTNNKVLQIDELEVKNLSFKTKYQTSINYKPLYISLIVSGIITMVGVILVSYYRKNKKRKINR